MTFTALPAPPIITTEIYLGEYPLLKGFDRTTVTPGPDAPDTV